MSIIVALLRAGFWGSARNASAGRPRRVWSCSIVVIPGVLISAGGPASVRPAAGNVRVAFSMLAL